VRICLEARLKQKGVQILISTKVIGFNHPDIAVQDAGGTRKLQGFDSVVICLGYKADDEMVAWVSSQETDARLIGDALQPRDVMEAVSEGLEAALKI